MRYFTWKQELVSNILWVIVDQTPLSNVSPGKYTFNPKVGKTVPIKGVDNKWQDTATFTVSMTERFLPIQLIYGGKTPRCLPRFDFPADFKGTLMQIRKSLHMFVFIWKWYLENFAFWILRILEILTVKFLFFLKSRLLFNQLNCFCLFATNTLQIYSAHISKSERYYNAKSVCYYFLHKNECITRFSYLHEGTFNVTFSDNHWSNTEKSTELFEKVIFPYLKQAKASLKCLKEQISLLIMDTFKGRDFS